MKRVPDLQFSLADSQAAADLVELMDEIALEYADDDEEIFEFEDDE